MTPLGRDGFAGLVDVSRETLERLQAYLALLGAWNGRINLVGASTLADPWRRHILDSAQLAPLIPPGAGPVADLGSGAGLPGLVLAILGVAGIHLVESDQRKYAFLAEAARITAAEVAIHPARAGKIPPLGAAVAVARALANLSSLLDLAEPHLTPHSICLFLKGRDAQRELTEALKHWKMRASLRPSRSDPEGVVMILEAVERRS